MKNLIKKLFWAPYSWYLSIKILVLWLIINYHLRKIERKILKQLQGPRYSANRRGAKIDA